MTTGNCHTEGFKVLNDGVQNTPEVTLPGTILSKKTGYLTEHPLFASAKAIATKDTFEPTPFTLTWDDDHYVTSFKPEYIKVTGYYEKDYRELKEALEHEKSKVKSLMEEVARLQYPLRTVYAKEPHQEERSI